MRVDHPKLDIELADTADAVAVLRLRDSAANWLGRRGIEQWRPGELPLRVVEERIAVSHSFVLRSREDTRLVATVTISFDDEFTWRPQGLDGLAGYVHTLVIDPILIGSGLGQRLMNWSETYIADAGRRLCRVDCAEGNPKLRSWYLNLGYKEVGRREYEEAWFPVTLLQRNLTQPSPAPPK
jgi:GNAT superfamily N-acetyltransferase